MFTWQGITTSGEKVVPPDGKGQTFAREFRLRSLVIKGPGVEIPFMVEIPFEARPVIFERHSIVISTDPSDTETKGPTRYFFGWEQGEKRHLWEFGGDKIVLHEE